LTSETLTWDPSTTLYEEQENEMTDHSGAIVHDAAVRGPDLVISALHSLTTDLADILHDRNFHQVLLSHVNISSMDTSLNGHIQMPKTAPIDHMTPGESQPDCPKDDAARGTDMSKPDACTTIPDQQLDALL
jgi:hypothetical protein